jgi:hypothetical protein
MRPCTTEMSMAFAPFCARSFERRPERALTTVPSQGASTLIRPDCQMAIELPVLTLAWLCIGIGE